jgi:hypothetical protein
MSVFALPKRTLEYDHFGGTLHIEATFVTSDGVASMLRTRLNAEGLGTMESLDKKKDEEDGQHPGRQRSWEETILHSWFYPDFAACCRRLRIVGVDDNDNPLEYTLPDDQVVDFEIYAGLPELFLSQAEETIYSLNPNWMRKSEDEQPDPKAVSSASASTSVSTIS